MGEATPSTAVSAGFCISVTPVPGSLQAAKRLSCLAESLHGDFLCFGFSANSHIRVIFVLFLCLRTVLSNVMFGIL